MPYPPAPESIAGSYDIPTSHPSPPSKNPPPQNVVQLNYHEDFPPPLPLLSGQVDPFDFAGGEKKMRNAQSPRF